MFTVHAERQLGGFALDARFSSARDSGVIVLAGASGAGKSSVLRCIAGLETPDRGRIAVGDRVLYDGAQGVSLPVHARRLGMVFQDSRLFPHLTVRDNLAYGRPTDRPALVGFDDAVALLGIGHLLGRRPRALSGGERQRVAIGRALLTSPDLLLMDEPLASLDAARKAELLPFLAALPRRFAVPILYVTHSIDELLQVADELVVVDGGRVVAQGAVTTALSALGGAGGEDAVLEGVLELDGARSLVRVGPGLRLHALGLEGLPAGHRVRMRVPADGVTLAVGPVPPISVRNVLPGRVVAIAPAPRGEVVQVAVDGAPGVVLGARVSAAAVAELGLVPGLRLSALVKAASIRVPGLAGVGRPPRG